MLSVHTTKQTKQNLTPQGCKETLRVVHMSIPLLVVMISLVFAYVQIHQIIHTKYVQFFSSVAQSCPTLCDPINCSTPGLAVHHQLPEFTQTQVHRVSDVQVLGYQLTSIGCVFFFCIRKKEQLSEPPHPLEALAALHLLVVLKSSCCLLWVTALKATFKSFLEDRSRFRIMVMIQVVNKTS